MNKFFSAFIVSLIVIPFGNCLTLDGETNDKGHVEIVSAVWQGPLPAQSIDVTVRIKKLLQSGASAIPLNCKEIAGGADPAIHEPKDLIIAYRVDGAEKRGTWHEGHILDLSKLGSDSFIAKQVEILSAIWQGPAPGQSIDVTANIKKLFKSDVEAIAVNCKEVADGRDPAPHQPKELIVTYSVDGAEKKVTWPEGRTLEFSVLRQARP